MTLTARTRACVLALSVALSLEDCSASHSAQRAPDQALQDAGHCAGATAGAGCDPPGPPCAQAHPLRDGANLGSDPYEGCVPPVGDPTLPACAPLTIAQVEADCAQAGQPCKDAVQISRDAAVCIAVDAGLPSGEKPPTARLSYNPGQTRPVWSVVVELPASPMHGGARSATQMLIDAETGAVLRTESWAIAS